MQHSMDVKMEKNKSLEDAERKIKCGLRNLEAEMEQLKERLAQEELDRAFAEGQVQEMKQENRRLAKEKNEHGVAETRRLRDQMAQEEEKLKRFRAERDEERRGLEATVDQLRSQVAVLRANNQKASQNVGFNPEPSSDEEASFAVPFAVPPKPDLSLPLNKLLPRTPTTLRSCHEHQNMLSPRKTPRTLWQSIKKFTFLCVFVAGCVVGDHHMCSCYRKVQHMSFQQLQHIGSQLKQYLTPLHWRNVASQGESEFHTDTHMDVHGSVCSVRRSAFETLALYAVL